MRNRQSLHFLRFRAFAALLAAVMLFAFSAEGESSLRSYTKEDGYVYLHLGRYPQLADGTVEPILWRVLTVDDEKAYLLSEYILFARSMHTSLKEYRDVLKGDFSQTELCRYLNSDFARDAFTEEEASLLLPFENFGKVFLLSREDMKNKEIGLGQTVPNSTSAKKILENPGVRAWGTEWAIQNNGFPKELYPDPKARVVGRAGAHISQAEMRLFVYSANRGSCSPYWGRTQSTTDARHATCTKASGAISHIEVGRDNEGVRPAVYLALNSFSVLSGAGTKDNPYEISPISDDMSKESIDTPVSNP